MLLLGDLGNGPQGTSLLPAALYSGGATRGCENCSFPLFFSSAMTLTNPSLKYLLLIFLPQDWKRSGYSRDWPKEVLAFSAVPSPQKGLRVAAASVAKPAWRHGHLRPYL